MDELKKENLVGAEEMKALYRPEKGSHKGQNGKLLIIGGSTLFHGASLWALKTASRIVDMVFYASVPENLRILDKIKAEVLDFIAIPMTEIESYIDEANALLIGPGMVRPEKARGKRQKAKVQVKIQKLMELDKLNDEGEQTRAITEYLLTKYPQKQWVVDAGALQVLEPEWIPKGAILTPHRKEFEILIAKCKMLKVPPSLKALEGHSKNTCQKSKVTEEEEVKGFSKTFKCIVLLKGERDIISDGERVKYAVGGNPGMTKGGTGDVLAGLVAGFACKNDPFLAARAGSFLNKRAGDSLYQRVGTMFNASDLCEEIPKVFKEVLGK